MVGTHPEMKGTACALPLQAFCFPEACTLAQVCEHVGSAHSALMCTRPSSALAKANQKSSSTFTHLTS